MTVDTRIEAALNFDRAILPPYPVVKAITCEDYVDWDGDDALMVHIVLEEGTDIDQVTGEEIQAIKNTIRDRLRDAGISLFAYTTIEIEGEEPPGWDD